MRFAVEITRDCNIQCKHCLRGPKKKVTMSDEHIVKTVEFINKFDVIDVSITGGEPFMCIDKTICLARLLRDHHVFLSTNATKRISDNEMELLLAALGDDSHIQISDDHHHAQTYGSRREWAMNNFKEFLDLNGVEYSCTKRYTNNFVIKEGRAKEWGNKEMTGEEIVYINALGEILMGCNWSYQSQKSKVVTTLDDPVAYEKLLNHLKGNPDATADIRLKLLYTPECESCPLSCNHSNDCLLNLIRWINTGEEPCTW